MKTKWTSRLILALALAAGRAQATPVWWAAAVKASQDAWIRSYQCHCEQAFAVDLRGESIIIRIFKQADERSISHITLTPNTVAVFHTHPDSPVPSSRDRELETRTKIPIYVIYYGIITESKWQVRAESHSSHAGTQDGLRTIAIYVYDYADARRSVLSEAERTATGILGKAGVETVWVDCPRDNASPTNPACVASPDPTHLILRVLPDSMSKGLQQVHGDAMGFTALGERFNCNAWIFYGGVKDFSLEQQLTLERLLGAVIAHELGHLLLGENVHASAGLMHGYWTNRELLDIESSRMIFSETESERIQSGVIARYQALSLVAAEVHR